MTRLAAAALVATALACGKPGASERAAAPASAAEAVTAGADGDASSLPMDAREAEQWRQAEGGDPEELRRLEEIVGCSGLRERASRATGATRTTAIRAMEFCPDFSELPWLARAGAEGGDADAIAALDAIDELAARPRRATDPEDAEELHEGCASLLGLARDGSRPLDRRRLAVRALRMLADRGCVRADDIPTRFTPP